MAGGLAGLGAAVLILTVAILVLMAISFWYIFRGKGGKGGKGCCAAGSSSSSCGGCKSSYGQQPSAYDVRTTEIAQLTVVTGGPLGATGIADSGFLTILSTNIKTCGDTNTLFCDVSAETSVAIFELDSNATGTSLVASSSGEFAQIDMRVFVDGFLAAPGTVTFDDITHLYITNLLPGDLRSELLSTVAANSFHFVAQNVPKGDHSVIVQARLQTAAFAVNELAANASAIIVERSLVVQPAFVQT